MRLCVSGTQEFFVSCVQVAVIRPEISNKSFNASISMVGQTEETLTSQRVPYEVGIAKYSEIAKSMMLGDEAGMLKLLFHRETRKLLGVHAIGQRATEIIHIGQAVMFYGGSVEYFRDTVFNYPTLAEAYKVAALDGLNKL